MASVSSHKYWMNSDENRTPAFFVWTFRLWKVEGADGSVAPARGLVPSSSLLESTWVTLSDSIELVDSIDGDRLRGNDAGVRVWRRAWRSASHVALPNGDRFWARFVRRL